MHLKKEKKIVKTIEITKQKKIDLSKRTSVIIPRGKDWDWALFSANGE